MIAGASVRYRIYTSWGFSAFDITQIVGFCTITLWFGFITLGGVFFLLHPMILPASLHLPFNSAHLLGIIFILVVGVSIAGSILKKRPLKISGWDFSVPSPAMLLTQITVGSLDWALAGTTLFVLLPHAAELSFSSFIARYREGLASSSQSSYCCSRRIWRLTRYWGAFLPTGAYTILSRL